MTGWRRFLPALAVLTACAVGASVVSAQTATFEPVGAIEGRADLVRVHDGRLYVAGGRTLAIYDISKPAAPIKLGAHEFPEELWGFRITGDRVYAGNNFSGLAMLDVSDPRAPALLTLSPPRPRLLAVTSVCGTRSLAVAALTPPR